MTYCSLLSLRPSRGPATMAYGTRASRLMRSRNSCGTCPVPSRNSWTAMTWNCRAIRLSIVMTASFAALSVPKTWMLKLAILILCGGASCPPRVAPRTRTKRRGARSTDVRYGTRAEVPQRSHQDGELPHVPQRHDYHSALGPPLMAVRTPYSRSSRSCQNLDPKPRENPVTTVPHTV